MFVVAFFLLARTGMPMNRGHCCSLSRSLFRSMIDCLNVGDAAAVAFSPFWAKVFNVLLNCVEC